MEGVYEVVLWAAGCLAGRSVRTTLRSFDLFVLIAVYLSRAELAAVNEHGVVDVVYM